MTFHQSFSNVSAESVIAWANLEILSLKAGKGSRIKSKIADSLIRISKALERNPRLLRELRSSR